MRTFLIAALSVFAVQATWAAADDDRVEKLVKALTLEEKISLISGTGFGTHPVPKVETLFLLCESK